jgi:hypothetical protein
MITLLLPQDPSCDITHATHGDMLRAPQPDIRKVMRMYKIKTGVLYKQVWASVVRCHAVTGAAALYTGSAEHCTVHTATQSVIYRIESRAIFPFQYLPSWAPF